MKDNKIDVMCQKLGMMRSQLNLAEEAVRVAISGIETLLEDFVILRKCSIDNPDFEWKDMK